jgi:assimilatory nitrate reductase catalytic subunit
MIEIARLIGKTERVSFCGQWASARLRRRRTAQSLINLALMTGNIGRPGTGANSITGQCNAMGSRLQQHDQPARRSRIHEHAGPRRRGALRISTPRASPAQQLVVPRNNRSIRDKIKGLWIIATNTRTVDQPERFQSAGEEARLSCCAGHMTARAETAELADLVLPAAGWGERKGRSSTRATL